MLDGRRRPLKRVREGGSRGEQRSPRAEPAVGMRWELRKSGGASEAAVRTDGRREGCARRGRDEPHLKRVEPVGRTMWTRDAE